MLRITLTLLACGLAPLAAQSVVVPAANATTRGNGGLNTLTRNAANPRTYQVGIAASHLTGIPAGSYINGISFRSYYGNAVGTWPPSDYSWTDYEISVGPAIPLATWTTTFANNFSAAPTRVRDNGMVITTGTYQSTLPAAPNANPWGEFYFDFQVPYLYTGGDLGILFTHPGSSGSTALFLDSLTSSATAGYVAYSATSFQAATGAAATFCIPRVHYGYGTGCAGTGGMVPNLVQNQNITGGGTMLFSLANAPATVPGVFAFGFGSASTPLPNGCTLLINPMVTVIVVLDAYGRASYPITLGPGLTGSFNGQGAVFDAGGPGGYTVTNAVTPTAN